MIFTLLTLCAVQCIYRDDLKLLLYDVSTEQKGRGEKTTALLLAIRREKNSHQLVNHQCNDSDSTALRQLDGQQWAIRSFFLYFIFLLFYRI